MSCIKCAIFSLNYYIKKNILLFFVYFIVSLLLITTYSLHHQVTISMENMAKSFRVSVSLSKKDSNLFPFYETNFFPYDIAKKVQENLKIEETDYLSISGVEGISIKVSSEQDGFLITGITNTEKHWEFQDGNNKLLKGRFLTKEDESKPYAIISEQAASDNNLDIGDKFTVQSSLHQEITVELEIVGIFSVEGTGYYLLFFNSSNNIYTPVGIAAKLNDGGIMEADFNLNDPKNVKSFIDEGSKIIKDHPDIVFTEMSSDFVIASIPMNSIISLCNIILLSTILMSIFVLCILVIYIMVGRFHEIGILLSLGESKFRIIFQITCELVIPMLAAVTTSIVISKVLILQFIGKWSSVNLEINTVNLGNSVLLIYCVGLILSILSSIIPVLNILRYNPKEILERFD